MITLESIREKLGFDPLNPHIPEIDYYAVDDSTPSIWAPLSKEELEYLLMLDFGDKFKPREWENNTATIAEKPESSDSFEESR